VSKPVLLLRLEGMMQSWGGRSRWDVRDTQPEPTKSGIIGLLGCAFGFERGDMRLEELDKALRFGVRVEHAGRELEDYQTITEYLPTAEGSYKHSGIKTGSSLSKIRESNFEPSTILSPRSYLEDAAFLVGLEAKTEKDNPWLEKASVAIQNPKWTLFLGRKTCIPTRPIFESLTSDYLDLEDALKHHPWQWEVWNSLGDRQKKRFELSSNLLIYLESEEGQYRRQDAIRVNPIRQYGFVTLEQHHVQRSEVHRVPQ
jgi:CRISPR system Cascade subunit CasD